MTKTTQHGHLAISPPTGVPTWDIDPYAADVQTRPAAFFDGLHRKGPFVYLDRYAMLACGRHAVTQEVFSDHTRFVSSRGVGLQDFALEEPWRPPSLVLEVDPPDHARPRRALMRALSPRVVADLRDMFATAADALIVKLLAKRHIDGVTDLAEAYPTTVFPAAVGLKIVDRRALIDYGAMVFNALGPDNAQRRAAMARAGEIVPLITAQCSRENLSDNGIGAGVYASADAGDISHEEAAMLVRSLLSAGVDTTVTAIGNALWCLATHPDQFTMLRTDPDALALPAFEETLRFTSPVNAFCRTAAADTEVAGVQIPQGAKILCVLGAANRDPDHWPDADSYDISRRTSGHLALGAGVHACVGQTIARAEGQAILGALARHVGALTLAAPPEWRPNNAMHALSRLPLHLDPA